VVELSILPLSTILIFYFGTVPTVWYFGTVPTVWYFRTVPTVWYFRTVPTHTNTCMNIIRNYVTRTVNLLSNIVRFSIVYG
jgi:hypothetical protein